MKKSVRESQYVYPKSMTIKTVSKILSKIEKNTRFSACKEITVYGLNQGSSIGLRLSQTALNSISLTQIQKDVIIGILLGDGHIRTIGIVLKVNL